eukprot:CAMPEP_0198245992 /NCGR_PEP_ID=MMETSP1446-20131203/44030_1 /TAXON_ID=1461542 ORGANISM="Unidentified sp, Strain CCMP2111" /NCGR_SAMPLE_ID=MMETSP1446 /ASSEMBLY_ACC=CAM_ASM_001112 /LENGTH=38 /DNA_ID= /DNA_START= /DNA_END= /DNA_ORIENTATION=
MTSMASSMGKNVLQCVRMQGLRTAADSSASVSPSSASV